jgi:D-alanyl-D-alanine carboxypeptidase/D-alanyl-D-alanine-endopeptidase (penicillin-binding protein 4)
MIFYINKKLALLSIFFLLFFLAPVNSRNNSAGQAESNYSSLSFDMENFFHDKALAKTKFSVAIYSLDKKTYYFNKNMEEPLIPASTTKLFTTSAALYNLGADFKVRTIAYTDADTVLNGVLNGNLFLAGFGDALLKVSDIDKIADEIISRGVKYIKGNIYPDGSYFDKYTSRLDYSGDRDIVQAIPPITALSLEMNTATIVVRSGSTVGSKVSAQVIPASDAFKLVITAKTMNAKKKKAGGITVSQKSDNNGYQTFYVSGSLPPKRVVSYSYTFKNPEMVTIGCLKKRLETGGCKISGNILNSPENQINDPEPHVLAEFYRPIIDLIRVVNKESDNYVAENVFKILGAGAGKGSNSIGARKQIQKMNDILELMVNFVY